MRRARDVVRQRTALRGQQPLWLPDETDVEDLGRRFHEIAEEILRLRSPLHRSSGVRIEELREHFDPPLELAAEEFERIFVDLLYEIVGILWLLPADRTILEDDLSRNGFDPTTLAAILDVAVEYGHIDRNPASGRRRRLPTPPPTRTWLDRAAHIAALLDAAGALDDGARELGATLLRSAGRSVPTRHRLRVSQRRCARC